MKGVFLKMETTFSDRDGALALLSKYVAFVLPHENLAAAYHSGRYRKICDLFSILQLLHVSLNAYM